ncbi:MAG TPA: nuclear transport factor 2 family protein [Candidatus Limnocylindrales bacterium]
MDDPGVAARYAAAVARRDLAALRQLRHPEYVARWPQSGELVRGPERIGEIERTYPGGGPELSGVRRLEGQDDLWTIESVTTYPDGSRWWWVTILELRDGLVAVETEYFCEPFEAPAWRAAHVERFDGSLTPAPPRRHGETSAADARRVGDAYAEAIRQRDFATLATLRADDWICEWPQSGERLRGHGADVAVHSSYPGYPELHVTRLATSPEGWEMTPLLVPIRIHGAGPIAIVEGINDYPSGERWFVAQLLEVADGKVHRETGYFARAFEAPAWRSALVERYDPLAPR